LLRFAACALAALAGVSEARGQGIAFVQQNWAAPQSSTSVNVTYNSAQATGNLNVVVVGWNDASAHVQSVTDSRGNAYLLAVGPTVQAAVLTQSIYYAKNIASATAGSNIVRVTFDRSAGGPDIRVAEYRGLDPVAPLDVVAAATGSSGGTSNSGSATTRFANELIVGANMVTSTTSGPGSGFTSRVITSPDSDILEDRIVTATGSYSATATVSSGQWIMQMVAFKAAGSGGGGPGPVPDLALTNQHTGSFTQGQTGATYTLTTSNTGTAATSGTVSVSDTLPGSLSATAMSGSGWSCVLSTLTCTRSDALAASGSYPAITLTVNVSASAPSSVTNTAAVSGGGETNTANNTASDLTSIGTVAPPGPGPVSFPVKLSANHRYLVDQNNSPFPILGRTAWFVTSVTTTDSQFFVDDSVSRGYNSIEFHVVNHDPRGNHPPLNGSNVAPFLKRLDGSNWNGTLGGSAPDFTTPNEPYWSSVDSFLAYCESKGVLVFMFPAYVGYAGGSQGWMQEVVANGASRMQTYGAWLATRYRNQRNIVWMMGGDMGTGSNSFNSSQTSAENGLLTGLKSVAGQQSTFFSAEWDSGSIATDQTSFGSSMSLNGVYSWSGAISSLGRRAYSFNPVEPAFLLEEPYDQEGPDGNNANESATQPVRRFQWWGWLTTIGGYISGNGYVWPFNSGWKSHLDTQGSRDMARINAFIRSIPWYELVPSGLAGMKTLVTAGGGSIDSSSYVSAAANPSGTQLVAYIGTGHTGSITIDMTAMSGTTRTRWFDPTSGTYTTVTGSPFPNTGTRSFTPPGSNSAGQADWVLTLDLLGGGGGGDTTAPSAPTNLSASAVSTSQINLTWTASTDNLGVAGYRIYRGGTQIGTSSTTSYANSGLNANTTYTYTVAAYDAAQNVSAQSQPASATTSAASDTTPPSTPTNLAASAVSSSQVNLTWSASTDNLGVAGYRIYRGGTQVGTSSTTSYSDNGLTGSTTYTYRVAAYDAAQNLSAQSQSASATTSAGSDATPPSTPTNLSSSNITSTSARISWTASTDNTGVAGYRVMRNGSQIGTSTATSYNDSGLSPSTTYTYTVAAYDAANNVSTSSQGLNVTTSAASFAPLAFVQLKETRLVASTNSVNTGTFATPVGAGNLMVAWVWYNSATQSVTSVTDTLGNVYTRAVGPTTGIDAMASWRQELWYAKNIKGGSGASVTATFTGTFSTPKAVSAHEYSGADPTSPLDATAAAAVTASNVSSGSATTTSPNEIVFGAGLYQGAGSQGTGFTRRSSLADNVTEDKFVTSTGSYSATFTNGSQSAIVQMATFRAGPSAQFSSFAMSDSSLQSASTSTDAEPLAVTPRTSVLTPTLQQQFATGGGAAGSVAWTVDGIAGGSAVVGTITPDGLYAPPAVAGTHTVTATTETDSATATVYVTTNPGTFTHHNDNSRTGQNPNETVLNPANVTAGQFGKLFSYSLEGSAIGSPLYVAGVTMPGQGMHNVVYVATEHDSVYAFDADGLSASPLWQRTFLGPGVTPVPAADTGDCCGIGPEIGITGTPVIDRATQTLYVVAKTMEGSGYVQRLHALDLGTGAEKLGGPVAITASVRGNGAGSVAGPVSFDALRANQRAALLLQDGVVYIAFGGHGEQQPPAHGWLMGYDAKTLQQVMAVNVSPDADGAGIWQANGGPAADAAGIYVITGNGAFDANAGGTNFGDSILRIAPNGAVADYFTPWNQGALNANGLDLGSAGPMLLPDQPGAHPHLMLSAGKNSTIYLIDRDAMGRYSGSTIDSQIVQSLVDVFSSGTPEPGNFSAPVYFNGTVYFGPVADGIQAFALTNGRLQTTASMRTSDTFEYPGATLAISSSGTSQGILWAVQRNGGCGVPASCPTQAPGVLKAYDATNLETLLYSSDQMGSRDQLDAAAKFSVPVVANGKVFVGSTGRLTVYGLLP
jgi:chitodextrinase